IVAGRLDPVKFHFIRVPANQQDVLPPRLWGACTWGLSAVGGNESESERAGTTRILVNIHHVSRSRHIVPDHPIHHPATSHSHSMPSPRCPAAPVRRSTPPPRLPAPRSHPSPAPPAPADHPRLPAILPSAT